MEAIEKGSNIFKIQEISLFVPPAALTLFIKKGRLSSYFNTAAFTTLILINR